MGAQVEAADGAVVAEYRYAHSTRTPTVFYSFYFFFVFVARGTCPRNSFFLTFVFNILCPFHAFIHTHTQLFLLFFQLKSALDPVMSQENPSRRLLFSLYFPSLRWSPKCLRPPLNRFLLDLMKASPSESVLHVPSPLTAFLWLASIIVPLGIVLPAAEHLFYFFLKNFVVLQGPRLAINFVKHPTTKLISFFFFFS